ncbi:MAG: peptide chain release factor N(5)-glutamine methyltransferase [Zetaproteobacteria bacterium CG12_big_fil_rev_8_21_14_0_65_54_13]|nr:MAG: protein-(glutamine-N5) methyltransferase, release factor-specific [Zetaproteobacteria bacterium CG23_combo_of_CG06-09_8_20_14_all_54_7]PIW49194.1 MAG: peptide chain release factor N(5)-glutamine methyltransferase [Zetaproteobacteria bacterium CG12_big_fil_rev_8_21_14_0_65_54_13]PIX55461.1 MAG: peptide chain release factor N(5)-glutamine methyltransferase [Zetaproteobacteria bacterium CG_4_10_14_3_um_filter_54_28]PJA29221.1 MAG: peptide chain release factor N(5)-glutamine methyltransferas
MPCSPTTGQNCSQPSPTDKTVSIGKLLRESAERLKQAGCDAPQLDAGLLLMHAWPCSRIDLIIRAHDEPEAAVCQRFEALVARRINREPLAYIIGEKEFWSRPFRVSPDVLIPRPETEHLIEAVIARFPEQHTSYRFCDIGTGSGCIAITLAAEYPQALVVATDISSEALHMAQANARSLDVAARMLWRNGDMLQPLQHEDGPFDLIISNPPYVSAGEMYELEPELGLEPRHALTDEADGLQFLATILHDAPAQLKPGGYIIVETGTCGLPATPAGLVLEEEIHDLAGLLRGAVYKQA